MTIPIMPGPFSFLAELGRAGGAASQVNIQEKEKRRKEAQDKLNQMISLRGAGLLGPEQFSTPEAMALYKELDILPVSDKPTPGEQISKLQGQYLAPETTVNIPIPSLFSQDSPGATVPVFKTGPRSLTDEQRAVAQLPSRADVAKQKIQAQALTGGTKLQQESMAGVPNANVVQAATDQATDQQYNSLANRAVDAAMAPLGADIASLNSGQIAEISNAAWQTAQTDAKMRGYTANEQFTRPYIDAAIAQRMREAWVINQRAIASQGGRDPLQGLYQLLLQQQNAARGQLDSMVRANKPSDSSMTFAAAYASKLAAARNPEEIAKVQNDPKIAILRQAYDEVQSYQASINALQSEIEGTRDQLNQILGGKLPGQAGAVPGRPTPMLSTKDHESAVNMIRNGQATTEQLIESMNQGVLNQADVAIIMQMLSTGTGDIKPPTAIKPGGSATPRQIEGKKGPSPYVP